MVEGSVIESVFVIQLKIPHGESALDETLRSSESREKNKEKPLSWGVYKPI